MKFALAKDHHDFFKKHHLIEFEGLIPPIQLNGLNEALDKALAERLDIASYQIKNQNSQKLFLAGRDLWRVNERLKKIVLNPQFAAFASELVHTRPLRIGYDQYLQGVHATLAHPEHQDAYALLLKDSRSLAQTSCLTGIACGLMICLSSPPKEETSTALDVFSLSAGSGIYFAPDYPIQYPVLAKLQGSRYLMIVYTQSFSQYYLEDRDFHTHDLKRIGYVFGDRVNDKQHPIVTR